MLEKTDNKRKTFLCSNLFILLYFIVYLSFSTYSAVQNCDTLQILDFNACFYKCIRRQRSIEFLFDNELTIGNFHSNPLMDLTKSLRWTLSSFLRSLELGCQTSPISRKGDFAGKILYGW